jgi:signal peptidase II
MRLLSQISARRWYFISAGVVFVADQISKVAAELWLRGQGAVTLIPGFFNLSYSRNRGGLFGFFATAPDPWRSILLTLVPLAAIVLIGLFLARTSEPDRSTLFGLSLILGGAAGNLLDRAVRGEVVDFLDVYASWEPMRDWLIARFHTNHWPTFNLADSAIVVGAGLLLLDIIRPDKTRKPE